MKVTRIGHVSVNVEGDLDATRRRMAGNDPAATLRCRASLVLTQHDPDLASVRDPTELAKLPETERVAWTQYWKDVAAALAWRK